MNPNTALESRRTARELLGCQKSARISHTDVSPFNLARERRLRYLKPALDLTIVSV